MGVSQTIYVGAYAECSGPLWLGGPEPQYQWEEENESALMDISPMCGPIVEGQTIYVPNGGFDESVHIDPREEEDQVWKIPNLEASSTNFSSTYAEQLNGLRLLWQNVVVKVGIILWSH